MLRLAVMGAHGTGKTTLVSALVPVLTEPVVAIQGIPRRLIKHGYKFGPQLELDAIAAYYVEQRHHEIEGVRRGAATLLTERTLLDAVAYEHANRKLLQRSSASVDILEFISQVAFDHINAFDLLVYCPISFPLHDDGVRGASVEYQRHVDQELWALVNNASVMVPHILINGPVGARVEQVLMALERPSVDLARMHVDGATRGP